MYSDEYLKQCLIGQAVEEGKGLCGRKIPWRDFISKKQDGVFDGPGVFIFGSDNTALSVGQTEKGLMVELSRRYIGNGDEHQMNQALQLSKGISINNSSRCAAAKLFHDYGVDTIWLMIFSCRNPKDLKKQIKDLYKPIRPY
ncbi:hypothetical protein [Chromobacterium haemolyticum]|uniref:hypothetical protein n=1 Tax=Chromobacterium haemolyticum TaxID=394935 RepID=UPI00307DE2AD